MPHTPPTHAQPPKTDHFAAKAQEWDAMPLPQAISASVGRVLGEYVAFKPTMNVMDFGAGTGLVASHLAPKVAQIWAVDVSEAMLEKLAAKPELQGKVQIVCQDILVEPLDRTFDLIVSAMALHHVHDTAALLARFVANLVPGGQIALADLDREDGTFHAAGAEGVHHHGFERTELAGLLADAGFVDVQFHTAAEVNRDDRRYPIFLVTAHV